MAAMPEIKSPIESAIEHHYRRIQKPRDSRRIGASSIGKECDRSIWYSFRWTTTLVRHEGRLERLFQTGHREEVRMIDDLRAIGVHVDDMDPKTGQQWEETISGVIVAKLDGKVLNVPGAEKTWHILEAKTMNDKSFQSWQRLGMAVHSPTYTAQAQIGMLAHGIDRALFIVHNKNTDQVSTERVKFDPLLAAQLVAKGERIAFSDSAPARTESYKCRFCDHEGICKSSSWARTNCRTCLHSSIAGGEWVCTLDQVNLTFEQQRAGCAFHLFLPDLVPGEQIDASDDYREVTYKLTDGTIYIDGRFPKPNVPEAIQ